MQAGEDGGPVFRERLLGDILCGYDLKRQGYARDQHQDRVDRGGVRESRGAQQPGRQYVVDEICDSDESRTGEQSEAAAE